MHTTWHRNAFLALAGVLAVGILLSLNRGQSASGASGDRAAAATRYSVIETQGHNLLVTDNDTNTMYFYTADKDRPVGSPLKLRASIDLSQVGQPQIRITPHNVQR